VQVGLRGGRNNKKMKYVRPLTLDNQQDVAVSRIGHTIVGHAPEVAHIRALRILDRQTAGRMSDPLAGY